MHAVRPSPTHMCSPRNKGAWLLLNGPVHCGCSGGRSQGVVATWVNKWNWAKEVNEVLLTEIQLLAFIFFDKQQRPS